MRIWTYLLGTNFTPMNNAVFFIVCCQLILRWYLLLLLRYIKSGTIIKIWKKIYNHLSTIEQQLEDTDNNLLSGPELERIEQQLNELLEKDFGNESINDKLQELLEAIKNIEIPDNYSVTIETDKN